ncbi:4-hydroxy-tetrahydrodipicolinate synthase [Candidatus Peregrinibacteria bacterium]|nr:4-hydroxy-tetrahydrodipicolinate synthase [Candidatus Peregrinibacteria bacterium]
MPRKYAGMWTAIVTPFSQAGGIDEEALRRMVKRQIAGGVSGIVPVGTTGESPTTTTEEDARIFEIVVEETRKAFEKNNGSSIGEQTVADGARGQPPKKVLVMAGAGSNSTHEATEYIKNAKKAGADCCLIVSPYYNKPTQKGLRLHYLALAKLGLPIIVYNIKGRTGVNIETDTLMEIARHPMIVGVKEASGDMGQIKEVLRRREELEKDMSFGGSVAGGGLQNGAKEFTVLSGDDGLTLEVMRNGGDGVVSVAGNLIPRELSEMVKMASTADFEGAAKVNEKFARLFKDIFVETNPIPVKYIASRMGLCGPAFRLPMCEPEEKTKAYLEETMKFYELI